MFLSVSMKELREPAKEVGKRQTRLRALHARAAQ